MAAKKKQQSLYVVNDLFGRDRFIWATSAAEARAEAAKPVPTRYTSGVGTTSAAGGTAARSGGSMMRMSKQASSRS